MTTRAEQGRERIEIARDQMRNAKLDALLVYSQKRGHVAYLSGYLPNYHTNSAFVILPLHGDPVLLVKFDFDVSRARRLSWIDDVRGGTAEDLHGQVADCRRVLVEKKLHGGRIGLVAADETVDELSVTLFRCIQAELPHATFEQVSDSISRLRLTKSPAEIECLRRATAIAEAAASSLQGAIAPHNADFTAWAAAEASAKREGADVCDVIISTHASRLALPPSGAVFTAGQPVTCELTVRYQGYWTQICRTLFVGEPSPRYKELFRASCDAYAAAVDACSAGLPVSAIAKAAVDIVDKAGWSGGIKYGLGHGVGLDLPEPHSVSLDSTAVLQRDMVLVIHVGLWIPDIGSAFVGGPLVVRDTGSEVLDHPQTAIVAV